eukprot:394294-Amphidinium_carterae.1
MASKIRTLLSGYLYQCHCLRGTESVDEVVKRFEPEFHHSLNPGITKTIRTDLEISTATVL